MAVKTLSALGVLYTDRRDFYLQPDVVSELWPSVTPFTSIVANRMTVPTGDPDFKMFEHRSAFINQELILDTAPAAWTALGVPGDVPVADIDIATITGLASPLDDSVANLVFEVWDSTRTTYKGVVRVQSVTDGNSISIMAIGNPRAVTNRVSALAEDDVLICLGPTIGEGQVSPEAWADELEVVYNSCEITRVPVEITGTLYAAALRGYSDELARLRMEKLKEFNYQREKKYLFGVRVGGTGMTDLAADNLTSDNFQAHLLDADGKTVRQTMGIIPAIFRYGTATGDQQNIFSLDAATYTYNDFVDDTEKIFQYLPNDGTLTALAGRGMISFWHKVSTGGFINNSGFTVQLMNRETDALGFNFRRLITPHGDIKLVYAPALRGPYNNLMTVIDPAEFKMVQYRPQAYSTNIKTDNKYDGVKDEYFADEGVGTTLIEKHSVWELTNTGS